MKVILAGPYNLLPKYAEYCDGIFIDIFNNQIQQQIDIDEWLKDYSGEKYVYISSWPRQNLKKDLLSHIASYNVFDYYILDYEWIKYGYSSLVEGKIIVNFNSRWLLAKNKEKQAIQELVNIEIDNGICLHKSLSEIHLSKRADLVKQYSIPNGNCNFIGIAGLWKGLDELNVLAEQGHIDAVLTSFPLRLGLRGKKLNEYIPQVAPLGDDEIDNNPGWTEKVVHEFVEEVHKL